ncbi:hypothetical protein HRI_001829700 [Hibiscus trionum]|uniref:Uncharacterized protein n=1 Tax=Hibiscus trionum TaxID=183268 RepID=A0A9W7LYE4_HIBTR|nr:hypothetical protein HRI_001829700 [Hibiscus trionum]
MSRHRRQASRVLPPDLSLTWEGEEQPPKSSHHSAGAQQIATPYGRQGSATNASTSHSDANPSTTLHRDYSSGRNQAPQNNPCATTKPS